MRRIFSFCLTVGFLSTLFLLGSCTTSTTTELSPTDVQATQQAIPALPTQLTGQQLRSVDTQKCLVKELAAIQISDNQGDLIAWSPYADVLAFVEPENEIWGWFIGNLRVYDPGKEVTVFTTKNQSVFGDLTWSPDGSSIAYVTFDQDLQVYKVKITDNQGKSTLELFGSGSEASTDTWASKKGIREWSSPDQLILTSSCGADCVRSYSFDIQNNSLKKMEEIRKSEDTSLVPESKGASPDGKWNLTVDADNNVWVSSVVNNQVYLLMPATEVSEIKWASSSKYFAMRTADRVMIYTPACFVNNQ